MGTLGETGFLPKQLTRKKTKESITTTTAKTQTIWALVFKIGIASNIKTHDL